LRENILMISKIATRIIYVPHDDCPILGAGPRGVVSLLQPLFFRH